MSEIARFLITLWVITDSVDVHFAACLAEFAKAILVKSADWLGWGMVGGMGGVEESVRRLGIAGGKGYIQGGVKGGGGCIFRHFSEIVQS